MAIQNLSKKCPTDDRLHASSSLHLYSWNKASRVSPLSAEAERAYAKNIIQAQMNIVNAFLQAPGLVALFADQSIYIGERDRVDTFVGFNNKNAAKSQYDLVEPAVTLYETAKQITDYNRGPVRVIKSILKELRLHHLIVNNIVSHLDKACSYIRDNEYLARDALLDSGISSSEVINTLSSRRAGNPIPKETIEKIDNNYLIILDELFNKIENKEKCLMVNTKELFIIQKQIKVFQDQHQADIARLMYFNYRLVLSRANKFRHSEVEFDDLVQEGTFGLLTAVNRFDPYAELKFSTYATHWIDQSIRRSIQNKGRAIRLPSHLQETLTRYNKAVNDEGADGKKVDHDKLMSELNVGKFFKEMYQVIPEVVQSLNVPVNDAHNEMQDFITSEHDNCDDTDDKSKLIKEALSKLEPFEKDVLLMRLGYTTADGSAVTLKSIGEHYGLSIDKIRQTEKKAVLKLQSIYA